MNFLSSLPMIGKVFEKLSERLWPDTSKQTEKILEIELEEVRQSGGRLTPRMLFKYFVACAFALYVTLELVFVFFPELGPEFPDRIKDLLPLAGMLFGFGN